jgi:Protein of unknown function (DUF1580)
MNTNQLTTEDLISVAQLARSLPPGPSNKPVSPSTVWRWITRGVGGCKLEAIRVGGRFLTSRQAVQRWSMALTRHLQTPQTDLPTDLAKEAS